MVSRLFLIAACLMVGGCKVPSAPTPSAARDPVNVYAAALRYYLKQASDLQAYVAIEDQDPPAALLDSLRGDWPNLKPASQEPLKAGYLLSLEQLTWIDDDTVELRLRSRLHTKFAPEVYFADYRLIRQGKLWIVEKVFNETMS